MSPAAMAPVSTVATAAPLSIPVVWGRETVTMMSNVSPDCAEQTTVVTTREYPYIVNIVTNSCFRWDGPYWMDCCTIPEHEYSELYIQKWFWIMTEVRKLQFNFHFIGF